jgi:hypothetical protein
VKGEKNMKKIILIIAILLSFLVLVSCTIESNEKPSIYINATYIRNSEGIDMIEFLLENKSDSRLSDLSYMSGDLYEYEVKNVVTKESITGKSNMKDIFILPSGASYNENIILPELKSGEYELFVGSSAEGIPRVGIETTFKIID